MVCQCKCLLPDDTLCNIEFCYTSHDQNRLLTLYVLSAVYLTDSVLFLCKSGGVDSI